MIDKTADPAAEGASSSTERTQDPVIAFCQQCGRTLTAATQRRVGAGVFCEPCATVRATQPSGWMPVNAGAAAVYPGQTPNTKASGEPNPALAGFLGLIPGVGAMYNGQYAKGVIHLIVFVVLVSLADNLNWVLWWFVWGWVFYQAFEAYHTAQAQRDGHPLPDPFGWNELGDRFGFARTSPAPAPAQRGSAPPPPPASSTQGAVGWQQFAAPPAGTGPLATDGAAMPDYGAAVPFSTAGGLPYASPTAYATTPYAPTFTGAVPASEPTALLIGSRRFPVGAAWLIGLGVLFLCANLLPSWHISGRWLVPILLAGIALWLGGQRIVSMHQLRAASVPGSSATGVQLNLANTLLGPVILLTVALLLALQEGDVLPLRHSWPAVLIVWGALLLLQRVPDPGIPNATVPVTSASAPAAAVPIDRESA